MNGHKSKLLLAAIIAVIFLLTGCGGGGAPLPEENTGGGGGGGTTATDSRFEFTLTAFDPVTSAPTNGLSAPGPSEPTFSLAVRQVSGVILAVNKGTGEEQKFNFSIEVDPGLFTVTNVALPLAPGTYDVFFLMTSGNTGAFQYAAITGNWIILDGQNVVPLLIAPLIGQGQSVTDMNQLKRMMEFEFAFSDEEVQKLRAADNPRFSISVDDNTASIFSINPATGLTKAFAVLEAGTYQFEIKFFDGDVLFSEPQIVTVVVPEEGGKTNVEIDLKPIAVAGQDQSVRPGDTVILVGNESTSSGGSLTYNWSFDLPENCEIMDPIPLGCNIQLDGATTVNPFFVADEEGDYTLQLIVTDASGLESNPDFVIVTTFNTTPVADPGGDQGFEVGDQIIVDGSGSFDEDGDTLTYFWTITVQPAGSIAVLSDEEARNESPTFTPDVAGTYILTLVVTDEFDAVSEEQTMTITSGNVAPVAVAGPNQSVAVGTVVTLTGSGSFDDNLDQLSYMWTQTLGPDLGPLVVLTGSRNVEASFTPVVPGMYIFSLVVKDEVVPSDPDNVTVEVHENQHPAIDILTDLIRVIEEDLDIEDFGHHHSHHGRHSHDFKHWRHKKALVNKIQSVIRELDRGHFFHARIRLTWGVLRKVDGCATNGEPDKHDWIITCGPNEAGEPDGQGLVHPLVLDAIESIEDSLGGS